MIKEDYYRDMAIFKKTHEFAELRKFKSWGIYLHSGEDFWSERGKEQEIFNLIAGTIFSVGVGRDYGKYVITQHNARFTGGIDDTVYALYCHLHEIDVDVLRISKSEIKFVMPGQILGRMGNTGNCLTKSIAGKYRSVTEKEVIDLKSTRGVHLHQCFYQIVEDKRETSLLKELKQLKIVKDNPCNYFWQWGKLFYSPKVIMNYFKCLQGRRIK